MSIRELDQLLQDVLSISVIVGMGLAIVGMVACVVIVLV